MRVYFDRTQSPHIARAAGEILNFLGIQFDHSRRRYAQDPGDAKWMSDLAAEADWLVITGDDRIRHNPALRRAWIQMGHTTFFLLAAWMKAPGEEQAWRLLRWLPQILAHGLNERRGTGLLLPLRWHGGKLPRLYSPRP